MTPETPLLPCPFCGGTAEYQKTKNGGTYIRCAYCFVSTALFYGRLENLEKRWNARQGATP